MIKLKILIVTLLQSDNVTCHRRRLLKWSRVDEGLLLSGFHPDSQNEDSDAAKIGMISESCKYYSDYFKFFEI